MSVVRNFYVKWQDFILKVDRIDLLDEGTTGLLGHSGSGKSTLVKALLGLYPIEGLEWNFQGENLCSLPIEKRGLGVVFQESNLFPHLTASKNIWFGAEARGHQGKDAETLFQELVKSLSLEDCIGRKADQLSGGERQRVALARAIMGRPRFLFLDEPFSALDADNRIQARAIVKSVLSRFKIPALLISHDREDIRALANLVYQIKNSQISKLEISSL